ncbi:hypothetical protein GUJ93_ZPchr0005g15945 [Zizania palustris]|uniref:Uncharacterized protein n=1 Tax=Zizania palustris TaxID=103762 RepID=A0A8J5W0H2_ZIZPA|nr:hypothetical protein GUJ93_ZPchr0005g15945 [Zizania palustris]
MLPRRRTLLRDFTELTLYSTAEIPSSFMSVGSMVLLVDRDVLSISSNSMRALFLLSSRWSLSFSWAPAMSSLASVAGDVALSVTFFSCCSCAATAVLPRDRFNHRK